MEPKLTRPYRLRMNLVIMATKKSCTHYLEFQNWFLKNRSSFVKFPGHPYFESFFSVWGRYCSCILSLTNWNEFKAKKNLGVFSIPLLSRLRWYCSFHSSNCVHFYFSMNRQGFSKLSFTKISGLPALIS